MSDRPMVSVIIPAYNCAAFLDACLASILRQRFQDYEVIVVDDGSSDGTGAVIARYASQDARIRGIRQNNAGTAAARNRALNAAVGEYVAMVDADDEISEEYLAHLAVRARETGADVISGGYTLWRDGVLMQTCPASKWDVVLGARRVSLMCVPTTRLYRAAFLREHGIRFVEGERFEVIAFSLMVNLLAERIENIQNNDYRYYTRPHSFTSRLRRGQIPVSLLPRRALSEAVARLAPVCEPRVLAFCVVKILAGVLFDNLRRHPVATVDAFSAFCDKLMNKYFPDAVRNPYLFAEAPRTLPFIQRAAMRIFTRAWRRGRLAPLARVVTRR